MLKRFILGLYEHSKREVLFFDMIRVRPADNPIVGSARRNIFRRRSHIIVILLVAFGALGVPALATALDAAGPVGNSDFQMLPQTGQTICYDAAGSVLPSCTNTGQDGDLLRGKAWPNPRFTNPNGTTPVGGTTVLDNLTGLEWARDAGTPTFVGTISTCTGGALSWQSAIDYVKCLNTNNYLGHNDWRLPNINELTSISNMGQANVPAWLNGQGFQNVNTGYYLSSTTYASYTIYAWFVNMFTGEASNYYRTYNYYVWPVRMEQPGSFGNSIISLPRTGQTTCYDASGNVLPSCANTGQDGELQTGTAWPNPRFTNPDGTTPVSGSLVFDNLTGLEWPRGADTPTFVGTVSTCTGGTMSWQSALDYVKCLNTNNYLGYNDWRLPNISELASIVNRGQADSAIWLNGQGFQNVESTYYWSSTTSAYTTSNAWHVNMSDARVGSYLSYKTNNNYVWPVRGGKFVLLRTSLISLFRTGQTACYDASGNPLPSCTDTGQDGDLLKGIAWPNPRFTNPNGTTPVSGSVVLDRLTGLEWARDAGTPTFTGAASTCTGSQMTWQAALDYVKCLNTNNYLGYNDWRLPNINELISVINRGQEFPSIWLNGQGFQNVQGEYWSSTTFVSSAEGAWNVNMSVGEVGAKLKIVPYIYANDVWPVRTGQAASVISLPQTGQTICYDESGNVLPSCSNTGQDGELQAGTSWLNPRFTNPSGTTPVNGSTVLDNLTGLEWARDAGGPTFIGATSTCTGGLMAWQSALDYVKCLNTNNYLGYSDWRLPNVNELISMTNREQSDLTVWLNSQGFQNVFSNNYGSSTTFAFNTSYACYVEMRSGGLNDNGSKANAVIAWPVRDGQVGLLNLGIMINWGATFTNNDTVTLALDASDPSGVTEMQFWNAVTGQWTTPEPYSRLKSWTLDATDGVKTVYVRFRDSVGNWSAAYSMTIEDRSLVKIRRGAYDVSHHQEITQAYGQAQSGDAIMIRAVSFSEDLFLNRGVNITLSCGWDDIFGLITQQTAVKSLFIGSGSISIEGKLLVH